MNRRLPHYEGGALPTELLRSMQPCSGPGSNRRFRFGRPALCRLSYHCAHPSQAPSGIRTRDIEPGQLAFCRLNYRRDVLSTQNFLQWARMESNHHLRFFRPPLYPRAASPRDRVRSAPPAGIEPATFRLTTGRSVPLSYGDVSFQRRVEESNLRDISSMSSALAVRCITSLPTLRHSLKRRVRDSNSQWPCDHRRFSRPVPYQLG